MKKIFVLLLTILSLNSFAQETANWDISTLRIGAFKVLMKESEAIQLARKPLVQPKESNNYQGMTTVKYFNELINVSISEGYYDENSTGEKYQVSELSTKSTKFKTKSGLGVGSSRDELWNAYKDMNRIEIYKPYDDNGNKIETDRHFSISDEDAGTQLIFVLRNNKVIEVKVSIMYEGC